MVHFGLNVYPGKYGLIMSKKNYVIINKKSSIQKGKIYTDKWCRQQYEDVIKNYELNLNFYKALNPKHFKSEIKDFCMKYPMFKNISDLRPYKNVGGYYILILDKYCQLYIGTSIDITRRIRQHWVERLPFDRLLFGSTEKSKLSIKSFRALDTTRILIYPTKDIYIYEDDYINHFSDKYICNRICGGQITDCTDFMMHPCPIKTRNLI